MQRDSILYLLKSQEIAEEKLDLFKQKLKDKNFTLDDCDKLLEKFGYEKIFTSSDDVFDEEENSYNEFEPIRHKKSLIEE